MENPSKKRENLMRAAWVLAMMVPALRLLPRQSALYAGRSVWLSPLIAIPVLLLYLWFLAAFSKKRQSGETFPDYIVRCLGRPFGKITVAILALWAMLYAGFLLRAEAERFVLTVYPSAKPWFFVAVMAIMGIFGAAAPPKQLARCAKVLLPFVFGVLLLALILALPSANLNAILPVTLTDAPGILMGAVPVINVCTASLAAILLFSGGAKSEIIGGKSYAGFLVTTCVLLSVVCVLTVCIFGDVVTSRLNYPFFSMVRNIKIGNTIQRVDALVVAVWVAPDFILISALLSIAARFARSLFGYHESDGAKGLFANGRYFAIIAAAIAAAAAVFIAKDYFALEKISHSTVPLINLTLSLLVLPAIYLAGKARKKI